MFPLTDGKKFLLLVIVAFLIAGVCVGAVMMSRPDRTDDIGPVPIPGARPVEVNDEVVDQVNADVVVAVGQPIEGTEPSMMMRAYPGLLLTDFESVQAQGGIYHVLTGVLRLAPRAGVAVSSADDALTDLGIMQTLVNAAVRLNMPSRSSEEFLTLLNTLRVSSGPTAPLVQNTITVTGQQVCLPHRDTSGPQTMECAFGIKVGNKPLYYALDYSELPDESWQSLDMETTLTMSGAFVPVAALSSNMWQIYPIEGIIRVKTITGVPQ